MTGEDIHGSPVLELIWTFIPPARAGMFVWGADLFFRLARPPQNAMEIFVIGKQWMWKVQHPEGVREINELHVPIGRPVKILLGSEDVLHDYFIPAFRVKMNAVPGKLTTLWFEATCRAPTTSSGGILHEALGMIGQIKVMTPQDYEAWLPATMRPARLQNGAAVQRSLASRVTRPTDGPRPTPTTPGSTAPHRRSKVVADETTRVSRSNPQAIMQGYRRSCCHQVRLTRRLQPGSYIRLEEEPPPRGSNAMSTATERRHSFDDRTA
jgi:cytochrome c oxidase subunit 2